MYGATKKIPKTVLEKADYIDGLDTGIDKIIQRIEKRG